MDHALLPLLTESEAPAVSIPAVRIDESFRILYANEAALLQGVQVGEHLLPPASDAAEICRLWHEACLRGGADSPIDPLEEEAQHVRVRIAAFHGFRLADIVYTYSLGTPCATAFLYRSSRYFFRITSALSEQPDRYIRQIQEHLDLLREKSVALLESEEYAGRPCREAMYELMTANAFLARMHLSAAEHKRQFRMSFLLDTYLSGILPQMHFIDCRIVRAEPDGGDITLPTDLTAMFLLWTAILRVLNDIADDRCIRIGGNRYGDDGEIRFSAHTARLAALPAHIPSVSVLASYLPPLRMFLQTADYLAGCLDCYLDLHPDPAAGVLTLSLYIPKEKHIPDFKSPRESRDLLREAIVCMRGLRRLKEDAPTAPPEAAEE